MIILCVIGKFIIFIGDFIFLIIFFWEMEEREFCDVEFLIISMDCGFVGYFSFFILNLINNGLEIFIFVDGWSGFIWFLGFFVIDSFNVGEGFMFVINLFCVGWLGIVFNLVCFCFVFFCVDLRYIVKLRFRLLFIGIRVGLLDCCWRLIFFFRIVLVLRKWCWCKYFKMILMVFVIVILLVWVYKWFMVYVLFGRWGVLICYLKSFYFNYFFE